MPASDPVPEGTNRTEDHKIILEIYIEIGRNERNLSDLEAKYRFLASGWALATLAAIGYVQGSRELTFFGLDKSLVEAAIGLLGAFGVTLIWGLDVRVYHQLLDMNFVEGLELERRYKFLPKGRYKIFAKYIDWIEDEIEGSPKLSILRQIKMFYMGAIGIGLLLATFFGIRFIYLTSATVRPPELIAVLVALGGLAMGGIAFFWLSTISKNSISIPINNWIQAQGQRRKAERNERGES